MHYRQQQQQQNYSIQLSQYTMTNKKEKTQIKTKCNITNNTKEFSKHC